METPTPTAAVLVTTTTPAISAGTYWISSSGGGLNLRGVPAITAGGVIAVLDDRTEVTATGVTSVDETGRLWVQLSSPLSGWAAAEFITSTPSVAPTPSPTAVTSTDPTIQPAATAVVVVQSGLPSAENWRQVRVCESGDNYSINTGNGYYGAYQFSIQTWNSIARISNRFDLDGVLPSSAAPVDQDAMANALYLDSGPHQWPQCGRFLPGF